LQSALSASFAYKSNWLKNNCHPEMAFCSPYLWLKSWVSMVPQGKKLDEPWRHGAVGAMAPGPLAEIFMLWTANYVNYF